MGSTARRGWTLSLAAVMIGASALAIPNRASSQVVSGVVLDAETRAPLVAALVTLLDSEGSEHARALVDAEGRFRVRAPSSGLFRVRAERMGAEVGYSGLLELSEGSTHTVRIPLVVRPIALEGIDVRTDRRCGDPSAAGGDIQRVWSETRKALNLASFTESTGAYRFEVARYSRELNPRTLAVRSERSTRLVTNARSPIVSRDADSLMTEGFVSPDPAGDRYFAPDATVLLSEVFLEGHCFDLVDGGPERAEHIGLSFEPLDRRPAFTDIAGTLWVSTETGHPEELEFTYRNLPVPAREAATDEVGGVVTFRAFPDGTGIITRWWIRMPAVEEQHDAVGAFVGAELKGLIETGGRVTRVHRHAGNTLAYTAASGTVVGAVAAEGGTRSAGQVVIRGLGLAASVDSAGRFRFDGLPEGTYDLMYRHDALGSLHAATPLASAVVRPDETVRVELLAPTAESVLAESCGIERWNARTAVVIGEVVDTASHVGAVSAEVTLSWQRIDVVSRGAGVVQGENRVIETHTTGTGDFRACGIPTEVPINVVVRIDGQPPVRRRFAIPAGKLVHQLLVPVVLTPGS